MRILLLTQWFQPETIFKGLPFARELKRLGHDVEVLTGFPNYPTGKVFAPYVIRPRMVEFIDGIRVVRVALYPSHDNSVIRRTLNYLSFAASAASIGLASIHKPDVAYVYYPPATVGLPAMLNRLLRGVPFVLDIQDLWPDTLSATGMFASRTGLWLAARYCSNLYRAAAHIVVLSPGIKQTLTMRGVPGDKISVIYNWADEGAITPAKRNEALANSLGLTGRFNVMFAGNMGLAQGLDTVLEAAAILAHRSPTIQFVLVGGGLDVARLKLEVKRRQLSNVLFLDRQPIDRMGELSALADVMLVHLKDSPLFQITIPSKIQACMAAGRPMICAVKGDAAQLVTNADAGVVCNPEQPSALADAVCQISNLDVLSRESLGNNGRRFYQDQLSLSVGASRFIDVFQLAIGSK